jgi:membrane fusion protein (multidrug efflux system)
MKWLTSVLLFTTLFTACNKNPSKSQKAPQKQEAAQSIKVGSARVKLEDIELSSELMGRVQSTNVSDIRPQVSGIIFKRLFKEGSFVKAGDQLFQIDPARYEVAHDRARGQLAQAQAQMFAQESLLKRFKKLIKLNAVSKQEYDNTLAAVKDVAARVAIAQAEVKNAKINLEYTKVLAPISGYIGRTFVTEGALVDANQPQPLATIRSLDPVYVDLSFPGAEALKLRMRLGQYINGEDNGESLGVTLKLEGFEEPYAQKGKILARELSVNEQSGSVNIRAEVPNPDLVLLPGMFVRAYVDQLGYGKRLVIPQAAIQRDQNGDANVWVITKSQDVERRRIETGVMYGTHYIVERGLQENELVAVDNFAKLAAGIKVAPVTMQAQADEGQ